MAKVNNKSELKTRRTKLRKEQTLSEKYLWQQVRDRNFKDIKFRRQHSIGYYILDFYWADKKIAIEIDGDSHFTEKGKEYDLLRDKFLESVGIKVIRFTNKDIFENMDFVLERIGSYKDPT
jgi:very-short-patch-repair endonuclease